MSDWLGCYGDTTVATPNIDALAEEGVLFRNAYMPTPVCSATRSALITGTMQTTHGLHQHRTMVKKPLPDGVQSIPEMLKNRRSRFVSKKQIIILLTVTMILHSPEFERPSIA